MKVVGLGESAQGISYIMQVKERRKVGGDTQTPRLRSKHCVLSTCIVLFLLLTSFGYFVLCIIQF